MNVYDNLRVCYLNPLPCVRPVEIRAQGGDLSLTEREARLIQRQLGECLAELDVRLAVDADLNRSLVK